VFAYVVFYFSCESFLSGCDVSNHELKPFFRLVQLIQASAGYSRRSRYGNAPPANR
jgi:hypothetical protein